MSDVLNGLDRIAGYCCITKIKAAELIKKGVIPCIVKHGQKKRYSTYTFVVDFIKEQISNNKEFKFEEGLSGNEYTNQLFTKYSLFRDDIFKGNKESAVVFANCNLKGGVGKTTSTISLASALSVLGFRVLILEVDPQSSISTHLGHKRGGKCFSDVVLEFVKTNKIIDVKEHITHFDFANGSFDGLVTDGRTFGMMEKIDDNNFIRNVAYRIREDYDFIIIDTPPIIQSSIEQSYIASDFINLITESESLSVSGIGSLLLAIDDSNKENINNGKPQDVCHVENTIVTKFDTRGFNDQIDCLIEIEKTLEDAGVPLESVYKVKRSIIFPESAARDALCPIFELNRQYKKAIEDGEPYFQVALNILKRGK